MLGWPIIPKACVETKGKDALLLEYYFYVSLINTSCENLDEIQTVDLKFMENCLILETSEQGFHVC